MRESFPEGPAGGAICYGDTLRKPGLYDYLLDDLGSYR